MNALSCGSRVALAACGRIAEDSGWLGGSLLMPLRDLMQGLGQAIDHGRWFATAETLDGDVLGRVEVLAAVP